MDSPFPLKNLRDSHLYSLGEGMTFQDLFYSGFFWIPEVVRVLESAEKD